MDSTEHSATVEPTEEGPSAGAIEQDEDFVQIICDLLFDVSQDSFALSDETIEAEPDTGRRAVYTGLLMLHDELRFQNEERTAMEAQLRQREARMRALIDLAKVAIWDCSIERVRAGIEAKGAQAEDCVLSADEVRALTDDLVIHGINREGLRMLGARSVQEVAERLQDIVCADDGQLMGALWMGIARGEARIEVEGMLNTLAGDSIRVLAGLSLPEGDADEDVAILTFADITAHHARVAAEQEARRRTEELARVNSEVERLFYAVAHDLRSPLRAVDTLAEWITEDLEAGDIGEVAKHVATLRGRIARLDRMLNDLLSYAKVGRTQHAVEVVDVDAVLDEICGGLLQIPPGFEVTWSAMPTITTQRTLLSQVLLNLISNALKHHDRDEGRITIAAEDHGDRYLFRVSDDGPGVPMSYRQKIFGLFSTLKRRDEVEGSGMGLAFVQKVVRRNGGRVVAEGPEGRGITFAFDWPKGDGLVAEPADPSDPVSGG